MKIRELLEEVQEHPFTSQDIKTIEQYIHLGRYPLPKELEDKVIDYAMEQFVDEIPYGTLKGRTGTMDEWIYDHLTYILQTIKGM